MMAKRAVLLFVTCIFFVGCSKKEEVLTACDLINESEVTRLASGIQGHDYFPKGQHDNEACVWHDGGNNNLVLVFYYDSAQLDPTEIVKQGMKGKKARVISVNGVGSEAAAAFARSSENPNTDEMKLFAAKNEKGMISIRVKGIANENTYNFVTLKDLANTALDRM